MKTKCSLFLWRSEDEREVRMGTFGVLVLFPERRKKNTFIHHTASAEASEGEVWCEA